MYIHISGWHTIHGRMFSSIIIARWHRWHSGRRCHLVWWRCTRFLPPQACLQIHCYAVSARKEAIHLIFTNHCWVSFHSCLQLSVPRKLNSSLLLFSDFGTRYLYQKLHFLYCGLRKPSIGHFDYIPGKPHVRLFQLYPPSLPSHSSWHVENLQESSCYIKKWDLAITSTIYDSVASSQVFEASFIHSRGHLSQYSHVKIPLLTTSWCLISRTVWTNAMVDHGGFPFRATTNWSRSSVHTPAVH